MKGQSTSELIVQLAREAERRKLYLLAMECKDLEEFKTKLRQMIETGEDPE